MTDPAPTGLSVVALGEGLTVDCSALQPLFTAIEIRSIPFPSDAAMTPDRTELNAAIDGAAHDWVLFLRGGERVTDAVAMEIANQLHGTPRAWGYRIPVRVLYCGAEIHLGDDVGEIRLLHRRHARFTPKHKAPEVLVQGAVVRMRAGLKRASFASTSEHVAALERTRRRVRFPVRIARFIRLSGVKAMLRGAGTLRYLWIEAAFAAES